MYTFMGFCCPLASQTRRISRNLDNYPDLQSHEFIEESLLQSLAGRKPTPPTLRSQALWSGVDK